jgi:hypothetical protein
MPPRRLGADSIRLSASAKDELRAAVGTLMAQHLMKDFETDDEN